MDRSLCIVFRLTLIKWNSLVRERYNHSIAKTLPRVKQQVIIPFPQQSRNETINSKFLLIAYEKSIFFRLCLKQWKLRCTHFFASFCRLIIQDFIYIFKIGFILMFFCSLRLQSYCAMFVCFCQGLILRFYLTFTDLCLSYMKTILSVKENSFFN